MTMTVTELEAMEAALTIKWGVILLAVISVCATILAVLALRRYAKDQDQQHAEAMARISASKDIGQTAWHQVDVAKTNLIRMQAKRIEELEAWKDRLEKRWGETTLEQYVKEARSNNGVEM